MPDNLRSTPITMPDEGARELVVNMGPQHPSTHGVLRVKITLNGETLEAADPDIGYLHRCFEKISEGLTYPQVMPYTDRTDYVAAITDEWAYALAAERLLGVEVPERAEYIRVIMGEVQRLLSHLIWFGSFAMDMGAVTPFLYAWRERETGYDFMETVTGTRQLYNFLRIGGVRNDIDDDGWQALDRFLKAMDQALIEYDTLFTKNPIFEVRAKGIGPLSAEEAIAFGASGPVLRGSGVARDLRRDEPYSVYDRLDFAVPVGSSGDAYDRYLVRMLEMEQSLRIIRQAIKQIPPGDIQGKVPKAMKPTGEAYARVEAPKGEVACYLVGNGTVNPYRMHWRSPCFTHLQLLPHWAPGNLVADMVVLIGTIDIILGEVDR